jgi:glyceraldehyde-3-phosphate dehydrogenase/erythrose-4-phosphate dehydrogenase
VEAAEHQMRIGRCVQRAQVARQDVEVVRLAEE